MPRHQRILPDGKSIIMTCLIHRSRHSLKANTIIRKIADNYGWVYPQLDAIVRRLP